MMTSNDESNAFSRSLLPVIRSFVVQPEFAGHVRQERVVREPVSQGISRMVFRVSISSGSNYRAALFVALCLFAAGCSESADQAIERRRKEYNEPAPTLAKFSGKVTVDSQPPEVEPDHSLLVFLYDPKNPPTPAKPARFTACQKDGSFQFGDGVAPGSYVVLFAELRHGRPGHFRGPEVLKNLYNDPDKNGAIEGFKVDLSPPGKTGQVFNLEIAGKEPVASPGSRAIVKVPL
jgi:hypothetical protein